MIDASTAAVAAKKQRKLDRLAGLDSIEKKLDIILAASQEQLPKDRDIPDGSLRPNDTPSLFGLGPAGSSVAFPTLVSFRPANTYYGSVNSR